MAHLYAVSGGRSGGGSSFSSANIDGSMREDCWSHAMRTKMSYAFAVGTAALLFTVEAVPAGSWSKDQLHSLHSGEMYHSHALAPAALYSFAVNTYPDGWAALKAEPWIGSRRMTKVYEGTLFLVVGSIPGWKLVRFKSGERGWIAERLIGCCRAASN